MSQCLIQAVRPPHALATEGSHELHVVVAGDRERLPVFAHRHGEADHADAVRPAVAQVAEEDRPPARRMREPAAVAGAVAERVQQVRQFVQAAVHVADQVERPAVVAVATRVQRRPHELRRVDPLRLPQHEGVSEALFPQELQAAFHLPVLVANDPLREVAIGSPGVPFETNFHRREQHDRDGDRVVFAGQRDRLAGDLHGGCGWRRSPSTGPVSSGRRRGDTGRRRRPAWRTDRLRRPRPSRGTRRCSATSVGRKWAAAKVDLPAPVGPTRQTSDRSGSSIGISSPPRCRGRRG